MASRSSQPPHLIADECSQAITGNVKVAPSHQPSIEVLSSLGIKVRDFAYENTLPAIAPVPRVPRQVQPAPRTPKRKQRDWEDKDPMIPAQPLSPGTRAKKPRPLERQPTEPLQEPAIQHTRPTLTVKRVCSIIIPPVPPRRALPKSPHTRFPVDPPTSPLTPPVSHIVSCDSELAEMTSPLPLVVRVDGTSMVTASQSDSQPDAVPFHTSIYTRFALDRRSSVHCSPPSNRRSPSPAPPTNSFIQLPSPDKDRDADTRGRKRRGRGLAATTLTSDRYQLRKRPVSSVCASSISGCSRQATSTSKPLPRLARRMR